MSEGSDISVLYREFADALTEVLAENAVGPARRGRLARARATVKKHPSDRLGRKRVYICGAIATGLFAFAYFAMFNTAIPVLIILATLLAFFFHDMMWGPLAALTAEVFTPRLRYSGASMGFQLASVFAGGPAPMIATALLAATGSGYVIALYIFSCAVVSIVATAMLPSTRDLDFAREHA
jgi:MFS family permease